MMKIFKIIFLANVFLFFSWSCTTPKTAAESIKIDEVEKKGFSENYYNGLALNTTKCASCHKAKKPENYSNAEWVKQVNRMAARAKITEAEKILLYDFGKEIIGE